MKLPFNTEAGPDSTQLPETTQLPEAAHLPVTQAYHAGLLAQAQPWSPRDIWAMPTPESTQADGATLPHDESTDLEACPEKQSTTPRPILSRASTIVPDLTINRALTRDDATYPEGGLEAWLVVFATWCSLFVSLGAMNTIGPFQSYFITHQLAGYDAGTIGWIFSVYAFFAFAGGIFIGPAFDKFGAKVLIVPGSIGICLTMFLVGLCTQYWHFMLVFGVLSGLSTSLIFTPSVAAIGHYFMVRRGFATGIATTGGAIGGITFPLMLEALIPKVGFQWSTRILGFLFVVFCTVACLLIKTRLPPATSASAKPDFKILRDPAFALIVAAVFLLEWGLFVPITYISSYALSHGFSEAFSYQIVVVLNVGSVFGRFVPGFYSDILGRVNTMILTTALAVTSVLCIWLPLGQTKVGLTIFALMFGFASGSNISLTPVCVGQLCKTSNYGLYYATCYSIVSIGCLTGIPIVGEILTSNHGSYWGMIIFVGACYAGGLAAFVGVRIMATGWKLRAVY